MRLSLLRSRPRGVAASLLLWLALVLVAAQSAHATTYTWTNSAGGSWSDASSWTPNGVPASAGDVAVLGSLGGDYQVTLDTDPAIAQIQLGTGATLDVAGRSLLSADAIDNAGTIRNFRGYYDGTIVVGPYQENAIFMSGSARIDGSGSIRLEGMARINCPIARPQQVIWLTVGPGQTLTGAGDVWVPIKNRGMIRQDTTGGPELVLHTYLYNYATIRVQDGGWINVDCPLVKQYGGTIVGNNGTFTLQLPYGNMGTLDNMNGGLLIADGGDLSITTLGLIEGHVQQTHGAGAVAIQYYSDLQNLVVDPGAEMRVDGLMDLGANGSTLLNYGTVKVRGWLNILGTPDVNISFTGNGSVVLDGGTLGTPAGALLTNGPGHTISGCGFITANIDNQGVINVQCDNENSSLTLKNGVITNRNRLAILRGNLVLHADRVVNKGVIDGTAGAIKVQYGATLENQAGAQPVLAGPGRFYMGWKTPASTVIGGTLVATGGGEIQNVGQAVLQDVRIDAGTTLRTIAGATTRASGAKFDLLGTNRVVGTGAFTVDAGTAYNQPGGTTWLEGGTLTVPGGYSVQGLLRGYGKVVGNVTNLGEVAPDAATDALRIQGDYTQAAAGHLTLGIGGADPTQFGRLAITGNAALSGGAYARADAGFAPSAGQQFAVVTAASRSGEFTEVGSDPGLTLAPVYTGSGMSLESSSTVGVPGDPALPRTLRFAPRGTGFVLELPAAADVDVRAYDVRGREVARLAAGSLPAGVRGLDLAKAAPGLSNGVYFARAIVTSATGREVRDARVVLLR